MSLDYFRINQTDLGSCLLAAQFHKNNYEVRARRDKDKNRASTAQKMKFLIKDFFSKCYQIRIFLRIWSHLLKKSLMENFIFC